LQNRNQPLTACFLETLLFGVGNRDIVTYAVILGRWGVAANYDPATRTGG